MPTSAWACKAHRGELRVRYHGHLGIALARLVPGTLFAPFLDFAPGDVSLCAQTRHPFVQVCSFVTHDGSLATTHGLPPTATKGTLTMQIQVNTDNHTQGSDELTRRVEDLVEGALSRFGSRITRVEVQLSDENSGQKSGGADKRCSMEARLTGLQPIVVSADAPFQDQALNSAVDKLEKMIQRTLGRLDDRKGRTSFAGEPSD